MSWDVKTVHTKAGTFLVATETITFLSATTDRPSSIVDFLMPGQDFLVYGNTGGANTASDYDIAIHVAPSSSGTFVLLKDNLMTNLDTENKVALYDVSANGESPYYKVVCDPGGAMASAETVQIAIVQSVAPIAVTV